MFEAPAQGVDVTVAKLFKADVEMLVNLCQKAEDLVEGALGSPSRAVRLFLPMLILDLFFAAVGFIKPVGQARVDFIEMST